MAFRWQVEADTELVGPMSARLWVSLEGGDVSLLVGVTKERDGQEVGFEGSYAHALQRRLDQSGQARWAPWDSNPQPAD